MKKIILALAAAILSAGLMSAQDMATATETYNNGAELLSLGDKAAALASFQEALKMGQACGEEGAELVANCKKVIPGIILSIGKEFYNKKSFDEALAKVDEAKAAAEAYGDQEILDEIVELVPQINGARPKTSRPPQRPTAKSSTATRPTATQPCVWYSACPLPATSTVPRKPSLLQRPTDRAKTPIA